MDVDVVAIIGDGVLFFAGSSIDIELKDWDSSRVIPNKL
jgi:hypothetical protein